MHTEKLKIILQQELQELEYAIHASRQTLKLLQLNTPSNGGSLADSIRNQQQLCKQLQDQHDKIVEQLTELRQ